MAVGRDLRDAAGAVRVQQYSQPVDDQQPIRLQVFTYHLSTEKRGLRARPGIPSITFIRR